jgi:hypothetical protein
MVKLIRSRGITTFNHFILEKNAVVVIYLLDKKDKHSKFLTYI